MGPSKAGGPPREHVPDLPRGLIMAAAAGHPIMPNTMRWFVATEAAPDRVQGSALLLWHEQRGTPDARRTCWCRGLHAGSGIQCRARAVRSLSRSGPARTGRVGPPTAPPRCHPAEGSPRSATTPYTRRFAGLLVREHLLAPGILQGTDLAVELQHSAGADEGAPM